MKTSWDLSLLFKNKREIIAKRRSCIKETQKFTRKWLTRRDYLENPKVLKEALDEYEKWKRNFGPNQEETYYYELLYYLNQDKPEVKADLNKAEEVATKLNNQIIPFELELAKIKPKNQRKFLEYKPLSAYKHFLEKLFQKQKHLLSVSEERIINLKNIPAHSNWMRMTFALLSKEERNGKTFSELLTLMNSQVKKERDEAAKIFNAILEDYTEIAEHELNSIIQNKKIDDELRKFAKPDEERFLQDDIDPQTINTLVKTVRKNFVIARDFYKLKARLLCLPRLEYHERNVEYGNLNQEFSFKKALKIIRKVLQNLDNSFLEIFERLLNGNLDVFPKRGKRNGAFCTHGLIVNPTYILLNFNNRLNDVLTLAHELGHAINNELIKRSQNSLNFETPVSTAEVSSSFFEDFTIENLIKEAEGETRLSLMMSKLNQDISSVFRQIAFYLFERQLHQEFRKRGYLSKEDIGKIFQKHMNAYMGDAVEQSKGSQNWWIYVEHFRYFFYVYSYASGLLISKYLQQEVRKDPKFITCVREFLSKGSSDSPKNIFKSVGIEIDREGFWQRGIDEIRNSLRETERLAKTLGKI